ncbi:RES family NAD+ phosphorylase [Donghicola eburneus]|uniref:RES family NAD+ phosphorylase n=1 Tax=Donghicola eburneus TaxID=393278 RepID=UPI0008EFCFFD|nr:RES family NAD+ phosphorylase [Donghicola eburneus]SFQ66256.1 RES domain-containing protein [Donghicola eburneus]
MISLILRKLRERRLGGKIIGCSRCFDDIGLRKVAEKFGKSKFGTCPICGSSDGTKLTHSALELSCTEFFVRGSIFAGRGWFAPLLQFNYFDRPIDEVGREPLRKDIRLLSEAFGLKVFLYGPPLWMFGKPAEEDGKQRWEDSAYQKICDYHNERELDSNSTFFRVQRNIEFTPEDARFCSPPENFRTAYGRFDSPKLPILYCSLDVETCLHESRVSLEDDIFVATMHPTRTLRLLDLTSPKVDFEISPFDDPRIWLKSLVYDHGSYDCCQRLASHIRSLGYDGFIVESYFQQAARAKHANLCLFDRPVVSGLVRVEGINKVNLHNVSYEFGFGPAIFNNELFVDEEQLLICDEVSSAVELN